MKRHDSGSPGKITRSMFSLALLLLCLSVIAAAQKTDGCRAAKPKGGKYELVFAAHTTENSPELLLDIVVEPENFTAEYLKAVAERILSRYCREDRIGVAIFDDKEQQRGWHYDFVTSRGKIERRRGTFVYDRKTGRRMIEFSTRRGNPIDEVQIDLTRSAE